MEGHLRDYELNRNLKKDEAEDVEQLTKEKEQAKERTNYIAEANKAKRGGV